MLMQQSVNSDWLSNTQPRKLQPDWFILEINEKATLNIIMPYWYTFIISPAGLTSSFQTAKQLQTEVAPDASLADVISFMGKVALEKGLANAGRYFLGYA